MGLAADFARDAGMDWAPGGLLSTQRFAPDVKNGGLEPSSVVPVAFTAGGCPAFPQTSFNPAGGMGLANDLGEPGMDPSAGRDWWKSNLGLTDTQAPVVTLATDQKSNPGPMPQGHQGLLKANSFAKAAPYDDQSPPSFLRLANQMLGAQTGRFDADYDNGSGWQSTPVSARGVRVSARGNSGLLENASQEMVRTVQGLQELAKSPIDPLVKQSLGQSLVNGFSPYVYNTYGNDEARSAEDIAAISKMRGVIRSVLFNQGVHTIDPGEPGSAKEFVAKVYQSALMDQRNTGIPAAITTAQAAQESGFGKQVPTDVNDGRYSYNLFGVKGKDAGTAGSVYSPTHEEMNGKKISIKDFFAAYNNFGESMDGHTRFLSSNPRYRSLFDSTDPVAWATGLQARKYATDSEYAKKLLDLIEQYNLR